MKLAVAALLLVASCRGGRAKGPAADDTVGLQAAILEGIEPTYRDECLAGPIWGAVDDPVAGERLDWILRDLAAASSPTSREAVCLPTLATARILRLERTGSLDLDSELAHPVAAARAVAVRHAALKARADLVATIRTLLTDTNMDVKMEAHDAVVVLADQGAVPLLQEIAATEGPDRNLACRTLWRLGVKDACDGEQAAEVGGILGSTEGGGDPCGEAQAGLAGTEESKQADAVVYFLVDVFGGVEQPYDRWMRDLPRTDCAIDQAALEALLSSDNPSIRGLAAAVVLWQRAP